MLILQVALREMNCAGHIVLVHNGEHSRQHPFGIGGDKHQVVAAQSEGAVLAALNHHIACGGSFGANKTIRSRNLQRQSAISAGRQVDVEVVCSVDALVAYQRGGVAPRPGDGGRRQRGLVAKHVIHRVISRYGKIFLSKVPLTLNKPIT